MRRVFLMVQIINANIYKRCLRLVLREITDVANGYRRGGVKDGNVSDYRSLMKIWVETLRPVEI